MAMHPQHMQLRTEADPEGDHPAMPPWGPWPDWLLSYCKLTSLTSFFCCDHHNNKQRLRFNTVLLWLTPTFLPDTFWLQGCGRWVHALIFYLTIVFSWVYVAITCFKLKILQRAKGANLLCPLDVRGLKCFQLQRGFAPWPPDQGLCPWTPLGALPQTPVIGSCSALAMWPPKLKVWIRQCTISIILCFSKHCLNTVHIENGR